MALDIRFVDNETHSQIGRVIADRDFTAIGGVGMRGARAFGLLVAVTLVAGAAMAADSAVKVDLGTVERVAPAESTPGWAPDFQRRFQMIRTEKALVIDGRVDEASWADAAPLVGFLKAQAWDDESIPQAASDRTQGYALYDDKGIYVGVRAFQDPKTIYTKIKENGYLRPDLDWQMDEEQWANSGTDEIEVVIDPELTLSSHYIFQVNPDGVGKSFYMPSARPSDGQYKRIDPVATGDTAWQAAASRDDQGWQAEFFIPWQSIGFTGVAPADDKSVWFNKVQDWTVMGFNVNRISFEKREASSWSVSRGSMFFRDAENFGNAHFRDAECSLENVTPGDIARGENKVELTVRSRSSERKTVTARMALAAEDKQVDHKEETVSVEPGGKVALSFAFTPSAAGRQTLDVTLESTDGWLLDRARFTLANPAPGEILLPKTMLFEDEGDLYAMVKVNAPEGIGAARWRLTSDSNVVASGEAGRFDAGTYLLPFSVGGLKEGRYELEVGSGDAAGDPASACTGSFEVLASPYAQAFSGTAGTPRASVAGAPEGFTALASDVSIRRRRRGIESTAPQMESTEKADIAYATEGMKKRGYVLCPVTDSADFLPTSAPRKAEIDEPLRAFAAGGEYEPITFAIFALTDLADLRIESTDLKSKSGAVIPISQMDLRAERADGCLVKQEKAPALKAGQGRRYFLTVYVAPGTQSGVYEGTLSITAGDSTETTAFQFLVLPFQLGEPPLWYSIYGNIAGSADPERDKTTFKDLFAHGLDNLTCIRPYSGRGGAEIHQLIWDLDKTTGEGYMPDTPDRWDVKLDEGFYESLKESGARGPFVIDANYLIRYIPCTQESAEGFEKAIRAIEAKRQEYGLPEFVYHLVDEPNNHYTYDDGRYGRRYGMERVAFYGEVLHKLGLRCYETINSGSRGYDVALKAADQIDIWCANTISDESLLDFWTCDDRETWLYNYAGDGRVKGIRSTYGLYPLSIGATGVTQWVHNQYTLWNGDEHKYVNTAMWEGVREGIDDARYASTLGTLIEELKKSEGAKAALAEDAEKETNAIMEAYPILTSGKVEFEKKHDASEWNKWRWIIARRIIELQQAAAGNNSGIDPGASESASAR